MAILDRLPATIAEWPAALAELPVSDARTLVQTLYPSWVMGELQPMLTEASDPAALSAVDRQIGRAFDALPDALMAGTLIIHFDASEGGRRRWCWASEWYLLEQDEDLMLFEEDALVVILEEAALGCPKRRDILKIAAHSVRDGVHHALWDGADELPRCFDRVDRLLPLVRSTRDEATIEYLERLLGYATAQRVDREQMRQRVLDLRRCHPHADDEPAIERAGAHWVARFDRANITRGRLVVEARTGRMWAEEDRARA